MAPDGAPGCSAVCAGSLGRPGCWPRPGRLRWCTVSSVPRSLSQLLASALSTLVRGEPGPHGSRQAKSRGTCTRLCSRKTRTASCVCAGGSPVPGASAGGILEPATARPRATCAEAPCPAGLRAPSGFRPCVCRALSVLGVAYPGVFSAPYCRNKCFYPPGFLPAKDTCLLGVLSGSKEHTPPRCPPGTTGTVLPPRRQHGWPRGAPRPLQGRASARGGSTPSTGVSSRSPVPCPRRCPCAYLRLCACAAGLCTPDGGHALRGPGKAGRCACPPPAPLQALAPDTWGPEGS